MRNQLTNGLRLLKKAIGNDGEHLSRLHTRNGKIPSYKELATLPTVFARRLFPGQRQSPGPWMAPGAVKALQNLITKETSILELGSGSSTEWYANRANIVISLEPDIAWASRVNLMLPKTGRSEVRVTTIGVGLKQCLNEEQFDLLVIDHLDEPGMSRVDAIEYATHRATSARIIVLDDSDRREYQQAFQILKNWDSTRYRGFRENPLRATETTIFSRP